MRFELMTHGAPLRQIQDLARDAAAAGFDGLVVTEGARTAYLTCAAAALAADIDISTGIAVAFPRSPMITAQSAWELAELSKGRFRLGIGTQVRAHIERRYAESFDPPGPRLREYVQALRAIFVAFRGETPLEFSGTYWSFSLLPAQWSPGPIDADNPPIDIAAVSPWMLRMAGEVADGVHVHPLNSPTYLKETVRPCVAEGARRAGRDAAHVELAVPVFTAAGDTEEAQQRWWEMARAQVAFYGSTPNYAFIFDQLGFEGTTAKIRERQKAGDFAGMANVLDDDLLAHFVVRGTWSQLPDLIVDRLDGVAARAIAYFAGATWGQDRAWQEQWGQVARAVGERTSSSRRRK
ncbi:MAG: TIGR03617 family F420-dependent LLM class oxidoreductase [Acidimicrobiia bacterium]|nr:TIGR03617 family F420-dependent LLM class oxidoreductase [Acidimicrobiia bacterium]